MSIDIHVNMHTMNRRHRNVGKRGGGVAESYLGRVIRLAREREGLTQRNLADAIDREQGYVSKIENGHTPAPDWVLQRWAPMLRVRVGTLILARAGIAAFDVEEDRRDVTVRFAGIMPADAVRWTEMQEREETMRVWAPMLDSHAPERCFAIQVSGDCLLTQGIRDGRIVLLREPDDHEIPANGTVVAARVGDECSLKIWWLQGSEIRLTDGDGHTVYRGSIDAPDFQLLGIYLNDWKPIAGMH